MSDETKLLTFADARVDLPRSSWALEPILRHGALCLICGGPKSGKSLLALALCAAFIDGRTFLNMRLEGATGGSLWIGCDANYWKDIDRAEALGIPLDSIAIPNPGGDFIDLTRPEYQARIREMGARDEVKVIAVKSLQSAAGGSRKDSDLFHTANWLGRLAMTTGKAVIAIHEIPRPGRHPDWKDDLGTVFALPRTVLAVKPSPKGDARLHQIKCSYKTDRPLLDAHISFSSIAKKG